MENEIEENEMQENVVIDPSEDAVKVLNGSVICLWQKTELPMWEPRWIRTGGCGSTTDS